MKKLQCSSFPLLGTFLKLGFIYLGALQFAHATIISTSGDIASIAAPSEVGQGLMESNSFGWTFDEQQNFTLSVDLIVDSFSSTGSGGLIAAGTAINSHFLHIDPVGDENEDGTAISYSGMITFDQVILGLVWTGDVCPEKCPLSDNNLASSDYLGAVGTIYRDDIGRGMEVEEYYAVNGSQDFFSISADGKSLSLDLISALPLRSDQVRIITASPVPLPGAGGLLLMSFLGLRALRIFK